VTLVSFDDPRTLPASFVLLEVAVLVWAGLTFVHARRAHRRGDRAALLTWVTIVVYGLAMEIISYNLVDNFAHGQFTVMFYDDQLPLYITAVYPVLLYTGIAVARRLRLPPAAEAVAAGLCIVALDAPFDMAGPVLGWWQWFDGHGEIAHRWAGVPVTSYYWHMAFGGILAGLTALVARRSRAMPSPWLALPLAAAVIALGMIAFAPFHALVALGVSDGLVVAGLLAGGATAVVATMTRAAW
jgi:hypothetical protein